jgi:hypothetical protein
MQPSAGKLMLTISWNSEGPILDTYLERRTTVKSATYCNMLQGGLKPAIHCKTRGRPSEGVMLLYENACPHTKAHTYETLRKLKWWVMEHWAHSPDLASSGLLKEVLAGRWFWYDKSVKNAVHHWLCAQPKTFYCDGTKKLVGHWEKCVEKQGDYVEKLCICFCNHQQNRAVKQKVWKLFEDPSMCAHTGTDASASYLLCVW